VQSGSQVFCRTDNDCLSIDRVRGYASVSWVLLNERPADIRVPPKGLGPDSRALCALLRRLSDVSDTTCRTLEVFLESTQADDWTVVSGKSLRHIPLRREGRASGPFAWRAMSGIPDVVH
jgi:hypothetical protein